MPILLAVVTVIQSLQEFLKMPVQLRSRNLAYTQLPKVLFWWSGLILIQQRMQLNKQRLVESVEGITLDQVAASLDAGVVDSSARSRVKELTEMAASNIQQANANISTGNMILSVSSMSTRSSSFNTNSNSNSNNNSMIAILTSPRSATFVKH